MILQANKQTQDLWFQLSQNKHIQPAHDGIILPTQPKKHFWMICKNIGVHQVLPDTILQLAYTILVLGLVLIEANGYKLI